MFTEKNSETEKNCQADKQYVVPAQENCVFVASLVQAARLPDEFSLNTQYKNSFSSLCTACLCLDQEKKKVFSLTLTCPFK